MKRTAILITSLMALTFVPMLSACSAAQDSLWVNDSDLDDAIMSARDGETVPIEETTDFEWDHVAYFAEGAMRDDISAVVGTEVPLKEERYTGSANLFVFTKDGEIVALVQTTPDALVSGSNTMHGNDAVLAIDENGYLGVTAGS